MPMIGPQEILIERVFKAPRPLVFKAWSQPEHLAKWWGPTGFTTAQCDVTAQPGGEFRMVITAPDGQDYPCLGRYAEVIEPEKIVLIGSPDGSPGCGAGLPPEARITVTFSESQEGTLLSIHTLFPSTEATQAAIDTGFLPGWTTGLERLNELLPQLAV